MRKPGEEDVVGRRVHGRPHDLPAIPDRDPEVLSFPSPQAPEDTVEADPDDVGGEGVGREPSPDEIGETAGILKQVHVRDTVHQRPLRPSAG